MSSWLNLTGNISSIRENLSSFTRDVLTEASQEDDIDISNEFQNEDNTNGNTKLQDYPNNEVLQKLQDEINILNLELSSRNQQIDNLESENYKIKLDAEKHVANLKQHLIEKETELDEYLEKVQILENYKLENIDLKSEIEDLKMTTPTTTAADNGWNDWSEDNMQEISKLEMENDSLSNELTMKEIVLDSIEKKMKQISKHNVDVADFTTWIDQLLLEKQNNSNDVTDNNTNKKIMEMIKNTLYADNIYDLNETTVSKWLDNIQKTRHDSENKIKSLEKQINDVYSTCSSFDETFTSKNISNWIATHFNEKQFYKTESDRFTKIISSIEDQIRENDEDDEKFVISEFSDWLEQQSSKIDDLSIEIINSQQLQEQMEEKRILEREKLEQLFNEKENEISMLKVELFNEKSKNQNGSAVEVMFAPTTNEQQNEELQEDVIELTARCQSLQEELKTYQHIKIDYENLRELYNDLEKEKIDYVIQNKELMSKMQDLETDTSRANVSFDDGDKNDDTLREMKELKRQLTEIEIENEKQNARDVEEITKKLVEITELKSDLNTSRENNCGMFAEIQSLQSENEALKERLNEASSNVYSSQENQQKYLQEIELLKANEENCLQILNEKLNRQSVSSQPLAMSLTFAINELASKYNNTSDELSEADKKIAVLGESLTAKDIKAEKLTSKLSELVSKYDSNYWRPEDDAQIYLDHIQHIIENFEEKFVSTKEKLSKFEQEWKEIEERHSTEIHQMEDIKRENHCKEEKIKELNNVLLLKDDELNEFKGQLNDYAKEVCELQEIIKKLKLASPSDENAPKRGRFGEMKRKIQELEDHNKELSKQFEDLKKNPQNPQSNEVNPDTVNKISELTKLLEEKTSEANYFEENCQELDARINQLQSENYEITNQFYQMQAFIQQSQQGNQLAIIQENQTKLHNLSLMLTEKSEECLQLQQQCDYFNAQIIEMKNDTSDMTLIQEECKQLKAMLAEKDHQSRFDETLNTMQEENKQLKHLLTAQDANFQNLQKLLIEKENEVSDMSLVREECKQLKQMLMDQNAPGQEIIQQLQVQCDDLRQQLHERDAKILETQNENSDMHLLQEECKELKKMLLEKNNSQNNSAVVYSSPSNVSTNRSMLASSLFNQSEDENSFLIQVKQLEEYIKEKEIEIEMKNKEMQHKDYIISDLQNSVSNLDLLMKECSALKKMLAEKEETFIELQNDLDNANLIVQQRNSELKEVAKMKFEAEDQLSHTKHIFDEKLIEIETLKQNLSETKSYEESIHVLQDEYRKVEEKLLLSEKTWKEETEEIKATYDNEIYNLENVNHHLTNKLQESQDRVLILEESEIPKYREKVSAVEKELEMMRENVSSNNEELQTKIELLENQLKNSQKHLDDTRNENILNIEKLQMLDKIKEEVAPIFDKEIKLESNRMNVADNKLHGLFEKLQEIKNKMMKNNLIVKDANEAASENINIDSLLDEVEWLVNTLSHVEHLKKPEEQFVGNNLSSVKCTSCEKIDNEVKKYQTHLKNLSQLMEMSFNPEDEENALKELTEATTKLQSTYVIQKQHVSELLKEKELWSTETKDLSLSNDSLNKNLSELVTINEELKVLNESLDKDKYTLQTEVNNLQTEVKNLQTEVKNLQMEVINLTKANEYLKSHVDEINTSFSNETEQSSFKIKDLESQLVEYKELEEMLQSKCTEVDNLNNKNRLLIEEKNMILHKADTDASEMIKSECMKLQQEIENQTKLYLDKTKELDQSKIEILKLEQRANQLQNQLESMKHLEISSNKLVETEQELIVRNRTITDLNSTIEDLQAKILSSQKEKTFLEEMVKENGELKQNIEQYLIQQQHLNASIQEKDVALKHQDVISKEVEAKTNRELERLRHHLMTIEDNHTQEILEFQQKQSEMEDELNQAKDILGRKSIILQDSNKQFQDHVEGLQQQLHVIAAQRDEQALQLSKCQDKIKEDANAMFNLQNALEQLQKEKAEQYEYLSSSAKRKQNELETRLIEVTEDQKNMQVAMSEASLAVQGISKIRLELNQKDHELTIAKEKVHELTMSLQDHLDKWNKMVQSSEEKLDKSLLRNLLSRYFQATDDKRADIVQVMGNLIGFSHDEIVQIGNGAAPSKVSGWMSNVWGFSAPKKPQPVVPQTPTMKIPSKDETTTQVNQSFSELFVKFLEHETDKKSNLKPATLMLHQTPPDILSSHKSKTAETISNTRIPAPGQEIPKVHTHHAQSTLKTLLS